MTEIVVIPRRLSLHEQMAAMAEIELSDYVPIGQNGQKTEYTQSIQSKGTKKKNSLRSIEISTADLLMDYKDFYKKGNLDAAKPIFFRLKAILNH